ncbi:methyltransferase domain-containing protein [Agrococcus beijingensis]|uniref:methyltransferase domain-containing protein n=1 Tax=Agrococcus beijingensis TaxID=3068634 RepID=UPI0027410738|nr:methyltransferase domain-containing protein [Agrococcus sp. REN33]
MLLPWLRERDPGALELMDDPDADPVALARTFARFAPVNAVVSGRGAVYRRWIRPRLRARARGSAPLRVLDVGTGGGDLPRSLLRLAARDGFALAVLAIDPDPRAIAAARARAPMAGLELAQTTTGALAEAGERFDVVLSNHVLHHLAPRELGAILAESERLLAPGGVVVHGDIERSPLAYAAFALGTLPFEPTLLRNTFIRADGLASIRRSHTAAELAAAAPPGWGVRRAIPWRLELVRRAP